MRHALAHAGRETGTLPQGSPAPIRSHVRKPVAYSVTRQCDTQQKPTEDALVLFQVVILTVSPAG